MIAVALGVTGIPAAADSETMAASVRRGQPAGRSMQIRGGRGYAYARAQSRRDFLRGTAVGVAGALGLVFVISLLRGGDE